MVISFTQKRKSQKYLLLIFVVLILAIAFIFLSGRFREEETTPVFSESIPRNIPRIEIDFSVLENPILKKLSETFPDLPSVLPAGEVGRENPFLSY